MTPLVPLWFLVVVAIALLALSVRALLLEREEGLRPSTTRCAIAAGLVVVLGGLAVWASLLGTDVPEAASAPDDDAHVVELKKQIAEKEEKVATLTREIADLKAQIPGAAPDRLTKEQLEQRRASMQVTAMGVGGIALVVGLGSMLFLGDPRTLLLRRRRAKAVKGPLDDLTRAATSGRFEDGLRAAAMVEETKLDALEQLDFLFLRATCNVQAPAKRDAKKALYEEALKDLKKLTELAPNMGEAHYLAGLASFGVDAHTEAVEAFTRAETLLGATGGLPFAKNKSVCLLRLGEKMLAEANAEKANACFDQVTRLGVLAAEIPATMISHRLLEVLRDLAAGKIAEARQGLAHVREVPGLDAARKKGAEVSCAVYELLILHREGEHPRVIEGVEKFLAAWLPKGLPEPDEHTADEYLFPAIEKDKMQLPPELFRGLYFLQAVAMIRVGARAGKVPEVATLAKPLLRALQFEPRHPEVLASLGALYYWCKPDRKDKGLEWLDAAIALGTKSAIVRRWLELDRSRELERKTLLDRFRGAASRFLGDAMVDPRVREALLEEFGRFQEFRPLLVELEQTTPSDIGQETPTLAALKERALYIQDVATTVSAKMPGAESRALGEVQLEYATLVQMLEQSTGRLAQLERRVMEEVGKIVLR